MLSKSFDQRIFTILWLIILSNKASAQFPVSFELVNESLSDEVCAPVTIAIKNNTSLLNPNEDFQYKWLEDGTPFSTQKEPIRNFLEGGTYEICLEATNSKGQSNSHCETLEVFEPPLITLEMDNKMGCEGLETTFDLLANRDFDNLFIGFGDGDKVSVQKKQSSYSYVHTFMSSGIFDINAFVEDAYGCKSTIELEKSIKIIDLQSIVPEASQYTHCSSSAQVSFTFPTEDIDDITWHFGDGQTSTQQNPVHFYANPGQYDVFVVVNQGNCQDTLYTTNPIWIGNSFELEYNVIQQLQCDKQHVSFDIPVSEEEVQNIIWDMGDGTIKEDFDNQHTFTSGTYQVKVVINLISGCQLSAQADLTLEDVSQIELEYGVNDTIHCSPNHSFEFFAEGPENLSYLWRLGDGMSKSGMDVSYAYGQTGNFQSNLDILFANGCRKTFKGPQITIFPTKPEMTTTVSGNCIPIDLKLEPALPYPDRTKSVKWMLGEQEFLSEVVEEQLTEVGKKDVILEVEYIGECKDTLFRENFIEAGERLEPEVIWDSSWHCTGDTLAFGVKNPILDDDVEYVWETTDGVTYDGPNAFHSFKVEDKHELLLRTNYNKCNSMTLIENIDVRGPTADFSYTKDCEDKEYLLLQESNINTTEYQWIINNEDTYSNIPELEPTPDTSGLHVKMTATDAITGCQTEYEEIIYPPQPLNLSIEVDKSQYCIQETMQIRIDTSGAFLSHFEMFTDVPTDITQSGDTLSVNFNGMGIIDSIVLTGFTDDGCVAKEAITSPIEIAELKPELVYDLEYSCDSTILTISPKENQGLSNTWYVNNTYYSQDSQLVLSYGDSRLTFFELHQTGNGCEGTARSSYYNFQSKPSVDFSMERVDCNTATYKLENLSSSSRPVTYSWYVDGELISNDQSLEHIFDETGVFEICLEATNNVGCSISKCDSIFIKTGSVGFMATDTFQSCAATPLVTTFVNEDPYAMESNWIFGDSLGTSRLMSPSHSFTKPGTYDITLISKDQWGCLDTLTREDYIKLDGPNAELESIIGGGCVPFEATFKVQANNVSRYRWDFGDGGGLIESREDSTFEMNHTYQLEGNYAPNLIVEDENGCEIEVISNNAVLVEPRNPNFKTLAPVASCISDNPVIFSLVQQNSEGLKATDLTWNSETVDSILISEDESQVDFYYSSPGSHSVTFEINNTYCETNFKLDNDIIIYPKVNPQVQFDSSAVCGGGLIEFKDLTKNNIKGTNEWQIGDKSQRGTTSLSHIFKENKPNILTFTTENIHGCSETAIIEIPIQKQNKITFDPVPLLCQGAEFSIEPHLAYDSPELTYEWIKEGTLVSQEAIFEDVAKEDATLQLQITDIYGCKTRETVSIKVDQAAQNLSIEADSSICKGEAMQLKSSYDIPNSQIIWYFNDNSVCSDCPVKNFTPENDGIITAVAIAPSGCRDSVSQHIEVVEALDQLPDHYRLCKNTPLDMQLDPSVESIRWSPAVGLDCDTCHQTTLTPVQTLTYTLTGTYKNCAFKEDLQVEVLDDIDDFLAEDQTICKNEDITLQTAEPVQWILNASPKGESRQFNTEINTDSAEIVAVLSLENCQLQDTMMVRTNKELILETSDYDACTGDTLTFSVLTNGIPSFSKANISDVSKKLLEQDVTLYTYKTILTNSETIEVEASYAGCQPIVKNIDIEALPKPEIKTDFGKYFFPDKIKSFSINVDAGSDVIWSSEFQLGCYDCLENYFTPPGEMAVPINLNVTNGFGCQLDTTFLFLPQNTCNDAAISAANAFTPNSDGENDVFRFHTDLEIKELVIFNRWGQVVFNNSADPRWDGTYQGQPAPKGLYTYKAVFKCPLNNQDIVKTDELFLIR